MFILPFANHFDWDKHDFNQDELSLKQTEELLPEFQESTSKNSVNDMQTIKRNINQLAKEN